MDWGVFVCSQTSLNRVMGMSGHIGGLPEKRADLYICLCFVKCGGSLLLSVARVI